MTKLQEILEELVKNCNYRHNVSPNNYLLYKQESIAQALLAIEGLVPSEDDLVDIIDNVTEGKLKYSDVYQPSFVGSSKKPMLNYLANTIREEMLRRVR